MARQTINIGIVDNDGTGDAPRPAGEKINANFAELYEADAGIIARLEALEGGQGALTPLSFSSTSWAVGAPSSGTILGATTGSDIIASGLPSGLTINGPARTWDWSGTGLVGGVSFTLAETPAGVAGSPRTTTITGAITTISYNNNVMAGFGDSISVSGPYAETWDTSRPDWTVSEIAQNGRALGTIANLNDGGNTVYGHLAQLLAVNAEVVYGFIGANDCTKNPVYTAGEVSAYVAAFQYIVDQVKANGAKYIHCTILPVSSAYTGIPHGIFNQNRDLLNAALLAGLTGVDAVADFGAEPTFISGGVVNPLAYDDGIHPSSNIGHSALTATFDPVADAVADALTVTYLPTGSWFGVDQTVTPNTLISGQFRVRDLAPGATIGLTVAGATAQIALNGGAFGATVTGARNGSIIRWQVTSPATGTRAVTLTNTGGALADTLTLTASASAATTVFSQTHKTANITLSDGDRTATGAPGTGYARVRSSAALPNASYCEIEVLSVQTVNMQVGIAATAISMTAGGAAPNAAADGGHIELYPGAGNQNCNFPGANAFHLWTTGCAVGDKASIAWKDGKVYVAWKGVWMNSIPKGQPGGWDEGAQGPQGNPATGVGGFTMTGTEFFAFVQSLNGSGHNGSLKINCGQEAFVYAVPAGFTAVG